MINKLSLCVFDMAGTTVDEGNVVYKTVQQVINNQGFEVTLAQVLAHGAGKEKYQAIVDVLTTETNCGSDEIKEIADKAFAMFKPALANAYNSLAVKPIAGVPELFRFLKSKGIAVVLNTGYDRNTAEKLLAKLDWQIGKEIDGLVTADDVKNGRPAPDMILKAMTMMGVTDASQVLKAGDSTIDVLEGINANCGASIAVLSGAQTHEQLQNAKPTAILESLADLEKWLTS